MERRLSGGRKDEGGRTESNCIVSSLCRGTTVTSSISHKKAISEGTSPRGKGNAIVCAKLIKTKKNAASISRRKAGGQRRGWLAAVFALMLELKKSPSIDIQRV